MEFCDVSLTAHMFYLPSFLTLRHHFYWKKRKLSKFTDIKARHPFHQCQGLFANCVLATLRLRTGPGRDGCQCALWDCFGGRICRHVENACPKQSHNALWHPSRLGLPRNLKLANSIEYISRCRRGCLYFLYSHYVIFTSFLLWFKCTFCGSENSCVTFSPVNDTLNNKCKNQDWYFKQCFGRFWSFFLSKDVTQVWSSYWVPKENWWDPIKLRLADKGQGAAREKALHLKECKARTLVIFKRRAFLL